MSGAAYLAEGLEDRVNAFKVDEIRLVDTKRSDYNSKKIKRRQ